MGICKACVSSGDREKTVGRLAEVSGIGGNLVKDMILTDTRIIASFIANDGVC